MINYYQIKSSLSQISNDYIVNFISAVSKELGEELVASSLETYLASDFGLLYVASGGSESYFLEVFENLKDRPCYILTSGDSNSLAASMEIMSYIKANGGKGEILHGDVKKVADRIKALKGAREAIAKVRGKKLGIIGRPSDWLISSTYSTGALMKKLAIECVNISIDELIEETEKKSYPSNKWTEELKTKNFDSKEVEEALYVYGAMKRIAEKYGLGALTVRCFDLLDTVHTTGCLGLAILNAEGIYGGCEGDVPALLAMLLLGDVTGEPVFLCNPSRFDTAAGKAVFAHCTLPICMPDTFELDTHFESGIGVAIKGSFKSRDCTVFKCSGSLSRYYAQEGTIEEMPFHDTLCRTQITVNLKEFDYFLKNPIGNHHIICFGKHKQAIEDFFEQLGD